MTNDPQTSGRGALEELDRDPSSRKRFLKALGGGGAVAAFGVFLAACGGDDGGGNTGADTNTTPQQGAAGLEMFGEGDMAILGYALTLEYLETDFYEKAGDSGKLSGKALDVAKDFGREEGQHVQALEKTIMELGGKVPPKPTTNFPLESQEKILELAATVENLGASAYLGVAPQIESQEILAAALSIHSIEGRHAAVLNQVIGKEVAPDGAFANPADPKTVLQKVQPFIKS